VLVTLDQTDAQQAFEKAQTQLAASVRQTRQQMINSKQLQANIDVQKTALAQAQSDLNRRVPLGAANLIGREELQHARDTVASAQASWMWPFSSTTPTRRSCWAPAWKPAGGAAGGDRSA
jgi:membrane fusion protein (multidrug efflux system)